MYICTYMQPLYIQPWLGKKLYAVVLRTAAVQSSIFILFYDVMWWCGVVFNLIQSHYTTPTHNQLLKK